MRRVKAYILTEIMMSMLLHSMLIVMLTSAFYMMLSFHTSTQQMNTARERGHSVIAYFDSRLRHVGLGLWNCTSSNDITHLMSKAGVMKKIALPISVISSDPSGQDYIFYDEHNNTFAGNVTMLLYAYRDFDNSKQLILQEDAIAKSSGSVNNSIGIVGTIDNADFNDSSNKSKGYTVMESSGVPLLITRDNNKKINLNLNVNDDLATSKVYAGSELLHLACERLFVTNGTLEERSFALELPEDSDWSKPYYHVPGILEIYMELHAPVNAPKTFDLYVLSTGGKSSTPASKGRPAKWPEKARWSEEYNHQAIYISRASWTLNNIPLDFKFW